MTFEILVFLVVLALAFDFMNGFHDAANSIATIVSTRVLRPQFAVVWAAFFNFVAFLFFGLQCRQHHRQGRGRPGHRRSRGGVRRAGRRHRLEHHHLVLRHSLVVVACADRRAGRRGGRQGRGRCADLDGLRQDRRGHRAVAAARFRAGHRAHDRGVVDRPARDAARGRPLVPPPAAGLGRRSTASATAATTRRRPWASSGCCCSPRARCSTARRCRSGW